MEIGTETSTCISHEPCPECGSRDNLARYSDGHGYCFGCGYYEKAESMEEVVSPFVESDFLRGEIKPLPKRGINEETSRKFDYRVAKHNGKTCQVANYYKDRKLVAQKLRFAP